MRLRQRTRAEALARDWVLYLTTAELDLLREFIDTREVAHPKSREAEALAGELATRIDEVRG